MDGWRYSESTRTAKKKKSDDGDVSTVSIAANLILERERSCFVWSLQYRILLGGVAVAWIPEWTHLPLDGWWVGNHVSRLVLTVSIESAMISLL